MTAVSQALTLRTKLLVAEYGRKRVIEALAQVEDAEFETIEREVQAVRERKSSRHVRPKELPELLRDAEISPQTFSLVERIAFAYENKRYLPELWRVRRFLQSHGVDGSKVRSRAAALPVVIKVLGGLSESEVTKIAAELSGPVRGDLRILADQILGRPDGKSRTAGEMAQEGGESERRVRTERSIK